MSRQLKMNKVVDSFKRQVSVFFNLPSNAVCLDSKVQFTLPLGDLVTIYINPVYSGYSKDKFGLITGFTLKNSHIIKIIKQSGVSINFRNDLLISSQCDIIDKLCYEPYEINLDSDVESLVFNMLNDAKDYYEPYIVGLTSDYLSTVNSFFVKNYHTRLVNPFTVGITLAYLAHKEEFVWDILDIAKSSNNSVLQIGLMDYFLFQNPRKEVVEPISSWVRTNPNWASGFSTNVPSI